MTPLDFLIVLAALFLGYKVIPALIAGVIILGAAVLWTLCKVALGVIHIVEQTRARLRR